VPEWSASAIYTGTSNSYAKQNNIAYQAKWWTQNNPPATNSGQWDVWKSLGACDTGGADTTPPSVPSGLSASNIGTSSITLSWAASTDAGSGVNNYELLRGGSLIASPTGTSHTDTGLSAGTAYSYQVRAKDKAGNVSALSAALLTGTASGNCAAAPATPAGLSAPSKSATSVNLAWNAVAAGPNCTVQYRVNQGATQVAQGAATSASVTNLTPDTSYTFTVSAFNQAGSSQPSAPITVRTDTQTAGEKVLLGYFAQWGIYGRNYHVKNIDTSGSAANLTHINYAFGNVRNNRCEVGKVIPSNESTGEGGDAFADYSKAYGADLSRCAAAGTSSRSSRPSIRS
jgi:chitinase